MRHPHILRSSHGQAAPGSASVKFVADAMLGRLARWLRILGFDVLYVPDIEDRELVRIAREQERTILTRDSHFLSRKGLKGLIFITSDDARSQLREAVEHMGMHDAVPLSRCPVCNGALEVVDRKETVRESVPDHVFHVFSDFIKCTKCGKVYWEGSHFQGIQGTLKDIVKDRLED